MSFIHIQGTGTNNGLSGDPIVKAFDSPVTAGHLVIAAFTKGPGSPGVVTASGGNTPILAVERDYEVGTGTSHVAIWYFVAAATGTVTITLTSSGSFMALAIDEYSFTGDLLITTDGYSSQSGTSSVPAAGTIVPEQETLVYGVMDVFNNSVSSLIPASGFTSRYQLFGPGHYRIAAEDNVATPADPVSVSWTFLEPVSYGAAAAAFIAVATLPDPPDTTPTILGDAYIDQSGRVAYFFLAKGFNASLTNEGAPRFLRGLIATRIIDGGSGYSEATVASLSGGILSSGFLTKIDVNDPGLDYTSVPSVVITGDGTGAIAEARLSGVVSSVTVNNGGSGYLPTTTLNFYGGDGTGVSGHVVLTNGVITEVVLDSHGSGYTVPPVIKISYGGPDGHGASFTCNISQGVVSVDLLTAGTGFTEVPVISFSGGGGSGTEATASALIPAEAVLGVPVIQGGKVIAVPVIDPGEGYSTAPTIVVSDTGGGVGASVTPVMGGVLMPVTAVAPSTDSTPWPIISVNGTPTTIGLCVTELSITSGGSGYTSVPTVTIAGGGGGGATATCTISGGVVDSLTLTNCGTGFTSEPTISFIGGGGTGAAASANLAPFWASRYHGQPWVAFQLPVDAFHAGDLATFTAPADWATANSFTLGATTEPTPMGNFTGMREPAFSVENSPLPRLGRTRFMGGMNVNGPCEIYYGPYSIAKDQAKRVSTPWNGHGSVQDFGLTDAGSGYTSVPGVVIGPPDQPGCVQATGTAIMVGGRVMGLDLTNPGTGYMSAPPVTIDPPGGGGTTAVANTICGPRYRLDGSIVSFARGTTAWAGFYYTIVGDQINFSETLPTPMAPTVKITGGGGTHAYGMANVVDGVVISITPLTYGIGPIEIFNIGSGYTPGDVVSITGGGGSGATATATIIGGEVLDVVLTNSGSGYTSVPSIVVISSTGSGASLGTLLYGAISATTGMGFTSAPTVELVGGSGTGATATATVSGGVITGFTVTNGGNGYLDGIWRVVWPDTNPAAPTNCYPSFAGTSWLDSIVTPVPTLSSPGTLVGGTQVGVTNAYHIQYTPVAHSGGPRPSMSADLNISIHQQDGIPGGMPQIFEPGNSADMSDPFAPDDNTARWLQVGDKTCEFMRFLDSTLGYGGTNNIITMDDMIDANAYSYKYYQQPLENGAYPFPGASRLVIGTEIRPYDITRTPNVYVHFPYPNAITSDDLSISPYMIPVASAVKGSWLNFEGAGAGPGYFICEFVTDGPHNIKTMQNIQIPNYTPSIASRVVPVTYGVAHPLMAINVLFSGWRYALQAFVTSPNSFVCPTFHGVGNQDPTRGDTEPSGLGNVAYRQGIGSVAEVTITDPGVGYDTVPDVTFSEPGGSGVVATGYVLLTGPVGTLNLTNFGTGYTTVPTVTIIDIVGSGATATAVLSGDAVTSITPGYLGIDYVHPVVTLTGGGGTGATAVAIKAGSSISGYIVTNGGSGYTSPPDVNITDTPGTGATAHATISGGIITGLILDTPGTGYTYPCVTFLGGGVGGSEGTNPISTAFARAYVTSGVVHGVRLTDGGVGYDTLPDVIFTGGAPETAATATCELNVAYPYDIAVNPQPMSSLIPHEIAARTVRNTGCGAMHVNVPAGANDEVVTFIATTVRDNTNPGTKAAVEDSNELWNFNQGISYACLGNLPTGMDVHSIPRVTAQCIRSKQIHDIFAAVFAETGRAGDVIRMFSSFSASSGLTGAIAIAANDWNAQYPEDPMQIDVLAHDTYIEMTPDDPFVAAAAACAASNPLSASYGAVPWTMGMYMGLVAHSTRYNVGYVGDGLWGRPVGRFAQHREALKAYKLAPGQTVRPYTVAYEGGMSQPIPSKVGIPADTDAVILKRLSHDAQYHPKMVDVVVAWHQMQQQLGMGWACAYNLCQTRGDVGEFTFGHIYWQGQHPGPGDGSDGQVVNQYSIDDGVAKDRFNVATMLYGAHLWWAGSTPTPMPTLSSITVVPINPSVVVGDTQQFTATGHYSDSSTQNLSTMATWTSSDHGVATISSTGLATTVGVGTSTITATLIVAGSTLLTVTSIPTPTPTLSSIMVLPTNPRIVVGRTQQFIAVGVYSDSSTQELTSQVVWESSDVSVAIISMDGLATMVGLGTSSITATFSGA